MHSSQTFLRGLTRNGQIIGIGAVVLGITAGLGILLFIRSGHLMEERLKAELRSIASVAVDRFDPEAVERIHGADSMESAAFRSIVEGLQRIRRDIPSVRYAYLMRRTENPNELQFVADADSLARPEELDKNHNGVLEEDEEASYPGDPYDISDVPALQGPAFEAPATDPAVTQDQWGRWMSGYAPIRASDGRAVAVLGLDMDADEYSALSRSIFSPIALMLVLLSSFGLSGIVAFYLWRRRLEYMQTLDGERSGLMQLATHRLGTPLTIMRWSLETLMERVADSPAQLVPAVQEHAENLREGAQMLEGILDELREAGEVESGKLQYRHDDASISDVIETVVKELTPALRQHRQTIELRLDHSLHLPLDRRLIAGVVRELLNNAIVFSPSGASIAITARHGGKCVLVEVIDHGCGMSKEDLKSVFQKFSRGKDAYLHTPDGSGLGLYIAKGIIDRAGGEIWMESVQGKGTKAVFTLPC